MCKAAPAIPAVVDDTTLAVFIAGLYDAWLDCYAQLHAVGRVYKDQP